MAGSYILQTPNIIYLALILLINVTDIINRWKFTQIYDSNQRRSQKNKLGRQKKYNKNFLGESPNLEKKMHYYNYLCNRILLKTKFKTTVASTGPPIGSVFDSNSIKIVPPYTILVYISMYFGKKINI